MSALCDFNFFGQCLIGIRVVDLPVGFDLSEIVC